MMRVFLLIIAFTVSFLGVAIANIPAALILDLANLPSYGVTYSDARGTIWRSAVTDVRASGGTLGRIDVAISPWSLLTGRLKADIAMNGPSMSGRGGVEVSLDGRLSLSQAQMTMDVSEAESLHDLVRARGGEVFVRIDQLVLDRSGCQAAAGLVTTDVLARPDGRTSWRGPELQGAPECRGSDLVLALNGADDTGAIRVEASLSPDGSAGFSADVETDDPDFQIAAGIFGFNQNDGAYTYVREVRLLDLNG